MSIIYIIDWLFVHKIVNVQYLYGNAVVLARGTASRGDDALGRNFSPLLPY